jgi:hypothetical protein
MYCKNTLVVTFKKLHYHNRTTTKQERNKTITPGQITTQSPTELRQVIE